ncbi:hypothetical protein [Actinokineospora sp.]|uniref:hypothetical protein n=1 Tax=Actinokineospora sp. TaxID=1872133 RepID=UPI0040383C4E
MNRSRRAGAGLVAALAVFGLAGCAELAASGGPANPTSTPPASPAQSESAKPSTAAKPKPNPKPADTAARKCRAGDVQAKVTQGESTEQFRYYTTIVVEPVGSTPCTLVGASELALFTFGDDPIEFNQVGDSDGAPYPAFTLTADAPGVMSIEYQSASAEGELPGDCHAEVGFVKVQLPGDTDWVDVVPGGDDAPLAPVCSAVETSPWFTPG